MTHEEIAALAAQVHARVLAWPVDRGDEWVDGAEPDDFHASRVVPLHPWYRAHG